jgi:hypothetical protein
MLQPWMALLAFGVLLPFGALLTRPAYRRFALQAVITAVAAYISVPSVHGDASLGCRDDALAKLVPPSHARTVLATNTHSKLQDTQRASWGETGFFGHRGHRS